MVTVRAHFDGKGIVPDEPLDPPPNQALILHIESMAGSLRGGRVRLDMAGRQCR